VHSPKVRAAIRVISWIACSAVSTVGPGVREIRVRDASGAFRILFVANLEDAVYVLHAFAKKARQTPDRDLALAKSRFRELRHGESP
jgi:phage-related protein